MRYADSLFGGVDVVHEHEQVVRSEGAVWIGKIGRPLARKKASLLNEQIDRGIPTFLYLVQRIGGGYAWTKATLTRVERELPAGSVRAFLPTTRRRASHVWCLYGLV